MAANPTESTLNEFGRFDDLKAGVDKQKAKAFFEQKENTTIPMYKVNLRVDKLLRDFVLKDGFDIDEE